ncbi:hypothetical protein ACP4OV_010265 [Aristida adscensionis]
MGSHVREVSQSSTWKCFLLLRRRYYEILQIERPSSFFLHQEDRGLQMVILSTAAILTIVGWAASPIINRLIGKLQSYTVNKYKWHQGLPEKLESMAHFLDEIGSTASLVEARGFKHPSMMCWLSQLKDAIDEADDIFDALDYDILKSKQQPEDTDTEPAGAARTASIGSTESSERLKKLLKKLRVIRQSSRGLVQASVLAVTAAAGSCSDGGLCGGSPRAATGPLLAQEPLVVGYEEQYRKLQTWLLPELEKLEDSSYNDRTVVAIVGHGGMGKTTLAQRAWNDRGVKERFDVAIWAWAYNKFSEAELLGEIWRSAAAAVVVPARRAEDMSFSSMQQALAQAVASRRYLLVLDDVCNDEAATELQRRDAWSNVLVPFRRGDRGSRVVVTTRAAICARTLGADSSRRLPLDGIEREPFVRLLKGTVAHRREEAARARLLDEALAGSALLSPASPWNNKHSPLSAKEMGLKLGNSSNTKWAEILTTDCHENVIAAHVSSYHHLPPHLQYCFAFLSLFPDNFRFQAEMLLKMWVAHGFVVVDDGSEEETARWYFNELLSRSLLQAVKKGGKTTYYVVHGQIHSMLRSVSANYFLMIQGDCAVAKIPPTVRHLSVTTGCLGCLAQLKKHSVLKRLRTFLVPRDPSASGAPCPTCAARDSGKNKDSSTSLSDLLGEVKGVRVLDLTGTDIADVPAEIGKFIHLRYFALPDTLHGFPKEFGKLFHLQTLIGSNDAQAGMNSLRGSLFITGLHAVTKKQDAQKAQLRKKKSVKILKLEWEAQDATSHSDLYVLEGLEPPTGLQSLQIQRYRGTSSPTWLENNRLRQLTHLYIINCRQWEVLPDFGNLPCLNHLLIKEMNSVMKIDSSGPFKALERLVLYDMKNLVEWTAGAISGGFVILEMAEISHCPELLKLPPMRTTSKPKILSCPKLQNVPTQILEPRPVMY